MTRICQRCLRQFTPRRKNSRYCSARCSKRAAVSSFYFRNKPEIVQKECPVCHQLFTPKQINSTCCSRKCCIKYSRIKHLDHIREMNRFYSRRYDSSPGGKALRSMYRIALTERMESDCVFYAHVRDRQRKYSEKRLTESGLRKRPYRPILITRIPDFMTKGQELIDRRSSFLWTSYDKDELLSAAGFSIELAIERGKQQGRFQE